MIDTHCHLNAKQYDEDRASVMQRAFDGGVEAIVIPAVAPANFDDVLELTASDPRLYCGVGVHPHAARDADDSVLERVRQLAQREGVVAIGEIGLDYYYDFAPRDVQIPVFRKQLQIARELDLPVIVHNRDAGDDIIDIIRKEQDGRLRGVLHCFSEGPERVREAVDLGFHCSFTGNITFKKSTLDATVAAVPRDRIMIETDGPYLSPTPFRGKRNEPVYLHRVAEKIAEILSISFDEVVSMTTQNAKSFFRLAILLMILLPAALAVQVQPGYAQDQSGAAEEEEYYDDDHYYDDDEYYEDEEYEGSLDEPENPYPKVVGIGLLLGGNTIVETETGDFDGDGVEDSKDISYDGLFAIGGSLTGAITDNFMVQVSYLYAKNDKVLLQGQANPNTHQLWDMAFMYTPNPYNRISLYFALGPSYISNNYDERIEDDHYGINGGISLVGNLDFGFGVITPVLEWRVSAILGSRTLESIESGGEQERSFFSSIPRFNLVWYPPL